MTRNLLLLLVLCSFFGDASAQKKTCTMLKKCPPFAMQRKEDKTRGDKKYITETATPASGDTVKLANGDRYIGEFDDKGQKVNSGTYVWANGEQYSGEYSSDKKDGEGTYTWPNGDSYTGEWKTDEPVKGKLKVVSYNELNKHINTGNKQSSTSDSDMWAIYTYEGRFMMGKREGDGTEKVASARDEEVRAYKGNFKNDVKMGYGTLTAEYDYVSTTLAGVKINNAERKYEGEWKNDMKNGNGKAIYELGNKYDGSFKDDARSGDGVFSWDNGDKYDGQWKNDSENGQGVFTWKDGGKYDGAWKSNKRNGRGIFTSADGDKYEGLWKNDSLNGRGSITWKSGDTYEGDFKDGKQSGHGVYTWANGDKYTGDWKDNKKEGHGVYVWQDGKQFDGEFSNDIQTSGTEKYKDGSTYKGTFAMGKDGLVVRSGHGVYNYINAGKYDGEWEEGRRNGNGKYYNEKGELKKDGLWKNGDFVGQ